MGCLGFGWQVHVTPVDDRKAHEPDMTCWCEPVIREGVIVHNSADRREFDEPAGPHLLASA